MLYFCFVIANT